MAANLTDEQKARIFDRLISTKVIGWRYTERVRGTKMVKDYFIVQSDTKELEIPEEVFGVLEH